VVEADFATKSPSCCGQPTCMDTFCVAETANGKAQFVKESWVDATG
jgi:hypothetical protein